MEDDLTAAYAAFAEQLANTLRTIPDPVERIRAVKVVLEAGRRADATVARVTSQAVRAMRYEDGLSYVEIGRRLGMSRARATKLGERSNPRS